MFSGFFKNVKIISNVSCTLLEIEPINGQDLITAPPIRGATSQSRCLTSPPKGFTTVFTVWAAVRPLRREMGK